MIKKTTDKLNSNINKYDFYPTSYDDYYNNAEILAKEYYDIDSIDEFYNIRNNITIFYAIDIDILEINNVIDIEKYINSNPIITNKEIKLWALRKIKETT